MDWVEWFLSREFRQFVLEHNLFFPLLFVVRLVGVTVLGLLRPARIFLIASSSGATFC
jgi:hypothetical protein